MGRLCLWARDLGRSLLLSGTAMPHTITVMAVLAFMLMQLNAHSFNQSVFPIFKVFQSWQALRGSQPPLLVLAWGLQRKRDTGLGS